MTGLSPSERFSHDAAVLAGRRAQQQVDAHADDDWKRLADAAIERVARTRERFTADDVWEHGDLAGTRENRALGPRLTAAARRRVIEATRDYETTRQVSRHGAPVRVWRSLVYEGSR